MLRIISGGQDGVDQAALRAARNAGLDTGGYAPHGWMTEAGPAPWLAGYGLVEMRGGYRDRTRANVMAADATLVFWVDPPGLGTLLTVEFCHTTPRPYMYVTPGETTPRMVAQWLRVGGFTVVNVAGSRESRAPGIGERAEAFLDRVFARLR